VPRLLLVTPAELTRDPRARRAATAARARGLGVVGLCGRVSGETPVSLEGVDVIRVGRAGRTDPQWKLGLAERGDAPLVRELRGLYRLARLTLRTAQLVRGGRRWGGVAIVHANDFATLPASYRLARESRARLVYDAHELYAEFEPEPPRIYRAVASRLEGALARRADAVVTVSDELAEELQRRFALRGRPHVVVNAPELVEREAGEPPAAGPLRAIYQGAFGTGRTLDDLAAAIRLAPSVAFAVRVPRADPAALRAELARRRLDDRVEVLPPLGPHELASALDGFDLGLVFDRPVTRNAELAAPNKLFEYLMAGLAVVAPRLPALASLVEREGVGVTFEPGRPEALAQALEELSADRARLAALRRRARTLAVERFNAERAAEALALAWDVG
jgi:glycogen(starch) synthase